MKSPRHSSIFSVAIFRPPSTGGGFDGLVYMERSERALEEFNAEFRV